MMKKGLLFILALVSFLQLKGQNSNLDVTGTVKDSTNTTLPSATVVLLQAKDSVMSAFTVTNREGLFRFKSVKPGDYILQITFIGYGNFSRKVTMQSENGKYDFGEITMVPKSQMLDEVSIVGDAIPIQIKKDTIEYNANAFKTKPNALVEDLLKKLPGVEVGDDGKVKAQGEEVKKIRVDGKEFFGNDTRIATKNLPADAVDKVQVFDEQSEMSQFTGIDDGEREKTINLSLKEGRHKGYFGNISAGYGTDNRYEGKGSINRFQKNLQLTLIGNANNINQQSYSTSGFDGMMGELGGLRGGLQVVRLGGSGESGSGSGITSSQMGGINLNTDVSSKTKLYGSYFMNHMSNKTLKDISRKNFLEDQTYESSQNSNSESGNYNHRLNLNLRHTIDDTQNLSLRTNISFNRGNNDLLNQSLTYDTLRALANSSMSLNNAEGDVFSLNSNLIYRKKFGDRGRNLVTRLTLNTGNDDSGNRLSSQTTLMSSSIPITQNLEQKQDSKTDRIDYGGQISYTEPLGRRNYFELDYEYKNYSTDASKDFFDIITDTEVLNTTLSTRYNRDYFYNRAGLTWSRNRDKSTIRVGVDAQNSKLKGQIEDNPKISQGYFYLLPSASYRFDITNSNHLSINYNTMVNEPSMQQLQPIVDNTNQLNLYVGNPDLKPQYTHRLGLNFNSFDQFNFRSFFAFISAGYTQNKITNSTLIDSLFRQVTMPVNVDYDYSINGFMHFGTPLKFMGSKINVGGNSMISKSLVFVNQVENKANRYITSGDFKIENIKKDHFDFEVGTRLTFNQTRYSESEDLNQDFTTQTYFSELSIYLGKWTLNTQINYSFYHGSAFPDQQKVPILKAYISRTFLKNDRGELKVYGFDLLNQNTGIDRSSDLNYIQEETSNVLGRYVMFSFTYSLRGMGGRHKMEFIGG